MSTFFKKLKKTTKSPSKLEENLAEEISEVEEDCPLCCCPLNFSDHRYPLYCPTVSCRFNYCSDCIRRFVKAASDGYQIASDGSRQLKVSVMCPMCRAKYETQTTAHKYSSDIIIQSVLILRHAAEMEYLLNAQDSELNASMLSQRQSFLHDTSMEELEDSFTRLQVYQGSLLVNDQSTTKDDKDVAPLRLKPLDWDIYREFLREKRKSSIPSKSTSTSNNKTESNHDKSICWKDPTLFGGLEESLTVAEHEFLTSMMTSGDAELIAQAATILHGVVTMSSKQRGQTIPTSNKSNDRNQESSRPVRLSNVMLDHMKRTRGRFPLPVNMPRCVAIPLYDPLRANYSDCLLGFSKDSRTKENTLTLSSVSGYAGRVGLRKGDRLTHVDGNRIDSYDEFVTEFRQLLSSPTNANSTTTTVEIIVNATDEVAAALKQRATDMKKNNIRFHY